MIGELIGRVFGAPKAVDNLLDKDEGLLVRAGGWFDDLSYTEQEKADSQRELREIGLRQLKALEPFKIVQRIIVAIVISMWAFLGLNIIGAIWLGSAETVTAFQDLAGSRFMWMPISGVVCLYLCGGVLPGRKS